MRSSPKDPQELIKGLRQSVALPGFFRTEEMLTFEYKVGSGGSERCAGPGGRVKKNQEHGARGCKIS